MTSRCPTCGFLGVPLIFGLPVEEAQRAAADGRLALGGCFLPEGQPPNWEFEQRHRWRQGRVGDQHSLIVHILGAYGYREEPEAQ